MAPINCKFCLHIFADQLANVERDEDTVRAAPCGAQCRLCLRLIAETPLEYKAPAQQQALKDKLKAPDSLAEWRAKKLAKKHRGSNGKKGGSRKADSTTDVNSESNVDGSQSEQVPTSSQDSKKKRGRRELSSEGSSSRGRSRVRSDRPAKRIKGRKRREQVVRWQVGIFWPLSKLSKFLAKQMKDRPCFRKPYVCDGVRGYLLDTSSEKKYGCPSGCAYVEDHAGDGVEYEGDKVLSSDLKNPEDIDTIWADIKSFKEVMTKPSEHTIAKNGPEAPHAVLVASRPPPSRRDGVLG